VFPSRDFVSFVVDGFSSAFRNVALRFRRNGALRGANAV
jgi:hypothetical protein